MVLATRIQQKLKNDFVPSHLEVVNESGKHSVPKESETHFKVVVVSTQFEGQSLIQRHRAIYDSLGEELRGGVHALAIHTYTPAEFEKELKAPPSPLCPS